MRPKITAASRKQVSRHTSSAVAWTNLARWREHLKIGLIGVKHLGLSVTEKQLFWQNDYLCLREIAKSSMESIMIWAKENYDLICLLVGVIGVLISIIGIVHDIKKKKRKDKLHS